MTDNQFHEIAAIFPLMGDDELQELADDIREHGLRNPIVRFEGKILDGRNRLAACRLAGVEPEFTEFAGDALGAVGLVWSENFQRRHLDSSQRAMAEAKRAQTIETYRESIDQMKTEAQQSAAAGRKRGGQQAARSRARSQTADSSPQKIGETYAPFSKDAIEPTARHERETSAKRAVAAGTNRQYVSDAERILAAAPDLAEKVEAGEMKISQAKLELKRREKREQLQKVEAQKIETTWELINADCVEALENIKPGSVRMIFADPPYNIGIDYGKGKKADQRPEEEFATWCCEWIERSWECLTADGSFWVMISDEFALEIGNALKDYGFHIRSWIKWYETFGVNCSNNFNRTSRHIFYCVKNPKRFVFDADAVRRPSARQTVYKDKRADSAGKVWDDVWKIPRLTGTSNERLPDFPTQLPLELVRPIVACASEPGDMILDPFAGSATTGVAAIELRRNFIGIEQEARFCEWAEQRLKGTAPAKPDG